MRRPSPPRAGHSPRVVVSDAAARSIHRGHPWLYGDGIDARGREAGDAVELAGEGGKFLAHAIVEPESPIVARVFSREAEQRIDGALIGSRLRTALELRARLVATHETTAYRLCNGEGDRLPGLVVDRYEHVAVLRTDGEAARRWVLRERDVVARELLASGVTSILLRRAEGGEGGDKTEPFAGEQAPTTVTVSEHGMRMDVDLARGQKTGAFLDQRENRRRVRELSAGLRVLNLFSYSGGFSLAAALGGAKHTTSVDIASQAHAAAQRSFRQSGVDPAKHAFVTADVFAFLDRASARGDRFDLVISDPPSFAHSEKAKPKALAAYRKLHAACLTVLAEGGLFAAASCSSHVPATDFVTTLDASALGRDMRLLELGGQPLDHPALPAWPEGRYLKFALLL